MSAPGETRGSPRASRIVSRIALSEAGTILVREAIVLAPLLVLLAFIAGIELVRP